MSPDNSRGSPAILPADSTVAAALLPNGPPPSPFTSGFSILPTVGEHSDESTSWATKHRRRRSIVPAINTRSVSAITDDLLPWHSPGASSTQMNPNSIYFPGKSKSLEGIAIRSFCLGNALALCVVTMFSILLFTSSPLWRIPFFIAALSIFHFLEFWTTAKYNTSVADIESFLLTANWPAYAIAHTAASLECLFTKLLFPNRAWAPYYSGHVLLLVGLILVFVGQTARSLAMIQAGKSFNHTIQREKKDDHELITTGVYSFLRHPSYFGFFYWAVGTQLVLGNPICFLGYVIVLWKFFAGRVKHEEVQLVRFFGKEYTEYKKRVGTGILFVGR
ncbi:Isoprenylcysteine carboxyl methyltransferase family-domain-containing protein [Xylaria nigripes]|nr:Isoprenylcysteine carboxyl methyltransferase family-domain-containing protein [Xylaria nigripes]